MPIGRFIAMVGFLVWRRSDGRYLLLQRSADKDFAPGEWETGSGRLDQGEGFADAVRRESMEELGVEVRIECILGTTHFYRGEPTPDNARSMGAFKPAMMVSIMKIGQSSLIRLLTLCSAVAFLLVAIGPTSPAFTSSSDSDRAVLTALYNATNGENWHHSDNWLSDLPLGEWAGVDTNRCWAGTSTESLTQRAYRGDTAGTGQADHPLRTGPLGQPVER